MADELRTEVEHVKQQEDVTSDRGNHYEEERPKSELDAGND